MKKPESCLAWAEAANKGAGFQENSVGMGMWRHFCPICLQEAPTVLWQWLCEEERRSQSPASLEEEKN